MLKIRGVLYSYDITLNTTPSLTTHTLTDDRTLPSCQQRNVLIFDFSFKNPKTNTAMSSSLFKG